MARIVDFLDKLAADPELEARFDRNPKAVMSEEGLTKRQQELIRDRTTGEVRDAIREELGQGGNVRVFLIKR